VFQDADQMRTANEPYGIPRRSVPKTCKSLLKLALLKPMPFNDLLAHQAHCERWARGASLIWHTMRRDADFALHRGTDFAFFMNFIVRSHTCGHSIGLIVHRLRINMLRASAVFHSIVKTLDSE
jgi:hypothetical protein